MMVLVVSSAGETINNRYCTSKYAACLLIPGLGRIASDIALTHRPSNELAFLREETSLQGRAEPVSRIRVQMSLLRNDRLRSLALLATQDRVYIEHEVSGVQSVIWYGKICFPAR